MTTTTDDGDDDDDNDDDDEDYSHLEIFLGIHLNHLWEELETVFAI